jgi:uncharacterized Fe-S cluster-containing radical SAM superfamily enzyme
MAPITFEDLKFRKHSADATGDTIRAVFLTRYYFDISAAELKERIGEFALVPGGGIDFPAVDEDHARKRLDQIIMSGLDRLRHILYDKPTIYIHEDTGIPLVGTNEFGLIDRGSNIIEVKPLTGCNFQCVYCSVDEGKNDKTYDYIVEVDYLVQEAGKLAARKEHPVEFNIGPQGEPLLYPKMVELVAGLRAIPNVGVISVNTNGSLLTKPLIDKLATAGLSRINLSLNAVDQDAADKLAGRAYPLAHVKEMIAYCQTKEDPKVAILLAPTVVPGYNDDQLDGLVQLGKSIKSPYPTMGFQNFLHYQKGRNIARERSFDEFFALLKPIEEAHSVNLAHFKKEDFQIYDEPELEKPFFKGDMVKARVVMPARYKGEIIACAKDRCITIVGDDAEHLTIGKELRVRIIRDKHNIFKAALR